jgi:uncharacterized protein YndB with AHSA1/START domain
MSEQIEREMLLEATPEEVWAMVTADGWLADEVSLDLHPGGDASFRSAAEEKSGWVEEARAPHRLAFWWTAADEPATRVELTLRRAQERTLLRVVETRPLELLDVVGIPLPGVSGPSFGPALVAA